MDPKTAYLQKHQIPELIDNLINKLVDAMPPNAKHFLADQLTSHDGRYAANDSMPDFKHNRTMLARVLTAEMYANQWEKKTGSGCTLEQCIDAGLNKVPAVDTESIGVVACDEECFSVFSELFDTIVAERHRVPLKNIHTTDLSVAKIRAGYSFDDHYVVGPVRVMGCRNVRDFRLPQAMDRGERRHVARICRETLKAFPGNLAGEYTSLSSMQEDQQSELQGLGLALDPSTLPYGATRDWPSSRGVFRTSDSRLVVHVNAMDHMTLYATADGTNLRECFERYAEALKNIDDGLHRHGREVMRSERLGHLTSLPALLGTGMEILVTMKLENLIKDAELDDVLESLKLAVRGEPDATTITVCNVERLGVSEAQVLQTVIDGVTKLIELEQVLEGGGSIDGKY